MCIYSRIWLIPSDRWNLYKHFKRRFGSMIFRSNNIATYFIPFIYLPRYVDKMCIRFVNESSPTLKQDPGCTRALHTMLTQSLVCDWKSQLLETLCIWVLLSMGRQNVVRSASLGVVLLYKLLCRRRTTRMLPRGPFNDGKRLIKSLTVWFMFGMMLSHTHLVPYYATSGTIYSWCIG